MKIDIEKDIDRESFMVHEHIIAGEVVTLVQPKSIGAKWNKNNLHFRSSVWNYEGELISASFPKFFNWGEQPDLSPVPNSLKNATVVEKLDGSTLIVSKYKGQYILRTRGTVDASTMANGHELELFKEKFLKSLTHDTPDTWNVSILFEWVSPINKIVLNYAIPQIYGEAQGYMKYKYDVSTLAVPMEHPIMSKTNNKQLELKKWF